MILLGPALYSSAGLESPETPLAWRTVGTKLHGISSEGFSLGYGYW